MIQINAGIVMKDNQSTGWCSYKNVMIVLDDDAVKQIVNRYIELKGDVENERPVNE